MSEAVTRAVLPAAGWGTRFLPATKAIPKEMLPVIDRPVIEYTVAEAAAVGITDIVVVVSAEKKDVIRRHFAPVADLERALEAGGKAEALAAVRASTTFANVELVVQTEQLGLGHAVATAAPLVAGAPFAVLLPDEVVDADLLARMLAVHEERDASVIGLIELPREELSAYGVPDAETIADDLVRVRSIVEKPAPADAQSSYATIGRYVFTPDILDALEHVEPGHGGEIQLTDAIDLLAGKRAVYGVVTRGGRWDVGTKVGMLRAALDLAMVRDDLRDDVRALLEEVAARHGIGRGGGSA
ncbi:MAG TPA: UTP--glucose-1-phosphate uridylyltransferase [Acidimicrobiia bacterium]|nr:UTP--glucose-1-phosphate uridylyltransferase [Acidimicrobiia bacterium]